MPIYLKSISAWRSRLPLPVTAPTFCPQNGLFPNGWIKSYPSHGHGDLRVHLIKLLDGFGVALDGFGVAIENQTAGAIGWILESDPCYIYA